VAEGKEGILACFVVKSIKLGDLMLLLLLLQLEMLLLSLLSLLLPLELLVTCMRALIVDVLLIEFLSLVAEKILDAVLGVMRLLIVGVLFAAGALLSEISVGGEGVVGVIGSM
jgi:hypothetical protein